MTDFDAHIDDAYQAQCDLDARVERAIDGSRHEIQAAHDVLEDLKIAVGFAVGELELDLAEVDACIRWLRRHGAEH